MRSLYHSLKAVADWTDRVAQKVLIGLSLAMLITILVQIFYRFVLTKFVGFSLSYTEELSRYLMIWMAYLGIAVGLTEGLHVAFDSILNCLAPRGRQVLYVITRVLMICFIYILITEGWFFIRIIWNNRSPAMQIPMWWAYLAVLVGASLTMLRLIVQTLAVVLDMEDLKTKERGGGFRCNSSS